MQPFAADIRPSEKAAVFSWLLHGAALAVGWLYFPMIWKVGITVLLAANALYARRIQRLRHSNAVVRIEWDTQGAVKLFLRDGRQAESAQLLSQSMVNPVFCLLQWQTEYGRLSQAVWPDSVPDGVYRRLLLWARYGRYGQAAGSSEKPPAGGSE